MMNDNGKIALKLTSTLASLFKPEIISQFRLKKDTKSTKMNDFLIVTNVPVTQYSNIFYFRDNNRSFKLDGDLSKTKTNYKLNVHHSNTQDRKIIFEFGKEMRFDIKQKGRPSNRDKSIIKLLDSPAMMASGISYIKVLQSDPDELCHRFELVLEEKQAGNNSIIVDEEVVVIRYT